MHRRCLVWFLLSLLFIPLSARSGLLVAPLRQQAEIRDRWLEQRLETILPQVMRREKIDMWLVICREYNEDPVFLSLVPSTQMSARRLSILVFFDRGPTDGVERLVVAKSAPALYRAVWSGDGEDQWQCLARLVAERRPQRIGIDRSIDHAFGDGLSASLYEQLTAALGPRWTPRLTSAAALAVGWLEQRLPAEIEIYHGLAGLAHRLIAAAFATEAVTPGLTRTEDVEWWLRQHIHELGLSAWFHPTVDIQRAGGAAGDVIRHGDLLHCDVGLTAFGLCTDHQQMIYIPKPGETAVPAGLQRALAQGNRLQDLLAAEYRAGRSGNEILLATLEAMKQAGIRGAVYTHPIGVHGHGAGPTIGLWDRQHALPGLGHHPLHPDTVYAVELAVEVEVPEWGGQTVRIGLEEDAVFDGRSLLFLDGRQTGWNGF